VVYILHIICLDGSNRTGLPLLVGFCYIWYKWLIFGHEFVCMYEGEVVPDHSVKALDGDVVNCVPLQFHPWERTVLSIE